MAIDDLDPIDSVGGQTPRSSFGEWGIIGLALLALVGGLLIATGNLIGKVAPSASPSVPLAHGSPSPTPYPTPQSTPEPSQLVVVLGIDPLPTPAPEASHDYGYYGWIRAKGEVPTLLSGDSTAKAGPPLVDGQVAWAETDTPGWLQIQTSSGTLWLEPAVAQSTQVERVQPAALPISGGIWSLAAGPNGFVAQVGFPSTASGGQDVGLAYSSNGLDWQRTDFPAQYADAFAWGPAGWLAASSRDSRVGPFLEIFRSPDGTHWERVAGAVDGLNGDLPVRMVGSPRGYVMQTYSTRRSMPSTVWTSNDGVTWRTTGGPLPSTDSQAGIAGLEAGFYAWHPNAVPGIGAFSADGEHWVDATGGPTGDAAQVVQLGNRFIGLDRTGSAQATRIFVGTLSRSGFAWDDPGGRHFGAMAATVSPPVIASDGHTAVILAFDWATESILEWASTDGLIWGPNAYSGNPIGGAPTMIAGGGRGIVLVGERPTLRGQNPVFWHRTPPGDWEREPQPLLDVVHDPPSGPCGPPPSNALDLQIMDLPAVVTCFGDRPITLSAWSVQADFGQDQAPGLFDPQWLGKPSANQLSLAPANVPYPALAVLSPSLGQAPSPDWRSAKLRVTGHFDDPAASGCRWLPDATGQSWYGGPQDVINLCRTRFVLTAVEVIAGS